MNEINHFFKMCMGVLFTCMSMHHLHSWCLQKPEGVIESPESRVMDSYELLCGGWEFNSGSQQEQPVHLTTE